MTAVLEKKLTSAEFLEMDFPEDNYIYELLNGEIVRRSSPNPPHQRLVAKMVKKLESFVVENQLGWVYPAPLDVFLGNETCVQPDIFFIRKERDFIIDNQNGILGTPDLIVEIISPGTAKFDRGEKKEEYERFAVKEYWLVDPRTKGVEIYIMRENAFRLHALQEGTGSVASTVLDGFELDVAELFED